MDSQDKQILIRLQRDSRQPNQEVAENVGLSASACWRRMKALEEAGIIKGYTALIDREKAGFGFSAVLHVLLDRHDEAGVAQFVALVKRRPEVLDCFATTGEADFHLRVVAADIQTYHKFLEDFLFRMPVVRHVRTNVILQEHKNEAALPF